ncbi:hypothetical protein QYE76_003696 [Lolium multiflorum]|uniref:RING-type domain-containing protein n=1 Tax=Lolium multiflorum TaxID=4521 RepID=A0AAD8RT08_LOLMU|nr:hypothetical protein QYE76_003696 [Lolium multiflorum]
MDDAGARCHNKPTSYDAWSTAKEVASLDCARSSTESRCVKAIAFFLVKPLPILGGVVDFGEGGAVNAEEWEQVATGGRDGEFEAAAVRSLEWEVLLAASSLGSLLLDDDDGAGVDTYFLDDDEDALFGQLAAEAEHDPPAKGGRAAARAAVEGLPTVAVAESGGAAQCAVCKDGIEAREAARRLPYAYLYHGACILPWLAIRNMCPLCRHELPDDAEYETWRARRTAAAADDDRYGHRRSSG